MAQKLYDESDDHYLQMQTQEDQEAAKIFMEAIATLTSPEASLASDEDLERSINDIRQRVKGTNSSYLKNAFPQLFN